MSVNRQLCEAMAGICYALASPKRLEILYALKDEERSTSDLATLVDLPTPGLSQHLAILKQHGLVESRRTGTKAYCRLAGDQVHELLMSVRQALARELARQNEILNGAR